MLDQYNRLLDKNNLKGLLTEETNVEHLETMESDY